MRNEAPAAPAPDEEGSDPPQLTRRQSITVLGGLSLGLVGCFGARTGLEGPELSRLAYVGDASPTDGRRRLRMVRLDVPTTPIRDLTTDPADYSWPTWSPDGRYLAFARWAAGNYSLMVKDLALGGGAPDRTIARLFSNSLLTQLSWGRNGQIAFHENGELRTVSAGSTTPATPARIAIAASYPSWTYDDRIVFADGASPPSLSILEADRVTVRPLGVAGGQPDAGRRYPRIVYSRGGDIFTRSLGGTGAERLVIAGGETPRFGPDDTEIAFAREGRIWICDAAGNNARPVTPGPRDAQPTWAMYRP